MMDHDRIYRSEAQHYDRMIAREDREGNLMRMIRAVAPDLERLDAADIGAGTGRLARMLLPRVRTILATDASQAMLDIAAMHLRAEAGTDNWKTVPGTNDKLPIADKSIDLLTAGWTICYSASSNIPNWEENLDRIVAELSRVLKPGGTAVVFENYSTGASEPNPPDFLQAYFCKLEQSYKFEHACIRTDYEFESPQEAASLTDFFFGSDISQAVARKQSRIVPEYTGVWWKTFRLVEAPRSKKPMPPRNQRPRIAGKRSEAQAIPGKPTSPPNTPSIAGERSEALSIQLPLPK